jgi:hypothetical protein
MRTKERLSVFCTAKFDATILVNMQLVKKEDLKKPEHPLKKIWETYFWCDGFPTISEHDNDEVIENFLEMVREETGARVDRSMVVGVPDWDIFNGPKDITRSKKKPTVFEQAMIEEGSEDINEGQGEDTEHDSVDEMVDTAEETIEVSKSQEVRAEATAAQKDIGTSENQENIVAEVVQDANIEKEKRSKKRNERPPASEEDKPVRAAKRSKTLAKKSSKKAVGTQKGTVSEPNINSNVKAQNLPTPSSTIDMSKPISMILPNQTHQIVIVSSSPSSSSSSSSSSEGTLSDYSRNHQKCIKEIKIKTKTKA